MALNTHLPHAVYTRQLWGDPWSLRPYLRAQTASLASGPDMSEATLFYKYGRIQRHGQHTFANYTQLDLSERYVKIEINGVPSWYGVVVDTVDNRKGEARHNGNEVLLGYQNFVCRGLEYLLHRTPIDFAYVKDASKEAGEKRIERAIGFNLGGGLPSSAERQGNRSLNLGRLGPIFAQDLQEADEWSAYDILEYLMAYHLPADKFGVDSLGWRLADRLRARVILDFSHRPTIHPHGKSFFELLNVLIDRRRLMGWNVRVDPPAAGANEVPLIEVFTFNRAAVALPDGFFIPPVPAAKQIANWDFDQDNRAKQKVLASDDASKYDQVIARGEPPGGCFTVSPQNLLLERDWTTAQQTAYRTGASTDPAYAALDPVDQHSANQQARAKESLKKVFRYFRISPTQFDGYIGNDAIWPLNKDMRLATRESWWPGLRLQDRLPLRLEHNYEAPAAVTNAMLTASKWEYQRPFCFVQEPGKRACFLNRMPRGSVSEQMESSGRLWSVHIRMQDDAFGLILDAPIPHVLGKNTYTPIDDNDATDYATDVDWSYIYCTVFAEGDGFVEELYPRVIGANPDTLKRLIVHVPNARLDYLVPGTVIDIDNTGTPVTTLGGFVRDDTDYLKNVARSAFEWYSTPRKSLQVTFHDLALQRSRGELVLAIGGANNAEQVNSVVTKITFDFRAGTTTYLTQFAELTL